LFTAPTTAEMLSERNYRFSKYCLYESSVRVPIILSGSVVPASAPAAWSTTGPRNSLTFCPPCYESAGASAPAGLQGLDLLQRFQRAAGVFLRIPPMPAAPAYMWAHARLETDSIHGPPTGPKPEATSMRRGGNYMI